MKPPLFEALIANAVFFCDADALLHWNCTAEEGAWVPFQKFSLTTQMRRFFQHCWMVSLQVSTKISRPVMYFPPWILPKMTRMLMCQRISASGNRRRTTLLDMTFSLLQEELRQGWIQPFPGDLGQAQLHRPPRLVMDPFGMLSS